MNPFGSPTQRPTEIVITPVNNGWIVTMPETRNEFSSLVPDMIKGIKDTLHGGDEIQEIINKSNVKQAEQEPPQFIRDQNVYIFTTFKQVLAFLTVMIEDDTCVGS